MIHNQLLHGLLLHVGRDTVEWPEIAHVKAKLFFVGRLFRGGIGLHVCFHFTKLVYFAETIEIGKKSSGQSSSFLTKSSRLNEATSKSHSTLRALRTGSAPFTMKDQYSRL